MMTDAERFDAEFFKLGIQYYAAARSAARSGFLPVCGNLSHHALEMFFKGRLINSHSMEDLKNRFGHRQEKLWVAFKADMKTDLEGFDGVIAAVNRFERLRYPEDLVINGAEIRLNWVPWKPLPGFEGSGFVKVPKYSLDVWEIDLLVATIFKVCSRNPKFFTGGMNAYAREAITYENEACGGWFVPDA
jgi:hypothetical protein